MALNPDEWARFGTWSPLARVGEMSLCMGVADYRAVAALALYGQPFGFTHEDVRLLRAVARSAHLLMENRPDGYWSAGVADADKLAASLADRIAALLPPEHPSTEPQPEENG